jgi:hypothetical protein
VAVRITYHCPVCSADINAQYWLPPVSRLHPCRRCGARVQRSGGSIVDAWRTFIMLAGYLPLAVTLMVVFGVQGGESLVSCVFLGLLAALFPGALGLMVLGFVVGGVVSVVLPEQPRAAPPPPPRPRDPEEEAYWDGEECPSCKAWLKPQELEGGWCEACGKKVPEYVLNDYRRLRRRR